MRFLIVINLALAAFTSFKVEALDIACQPVAEEKIIKLENKYRGEVQIYTEDEDGTIFVSLSFPENIEGLKLNTVGFTLGKKDSPLIMAPLEYKVLLGEGHSAFFINRSLANDLFIYLAYGYCPVTLNYKVASES